MGGIGSGWNRKSVEEHRRNGTYRPSRHATRREIGEVVSLPGTPMPTPRADEPMPPQHLAKRGLAMWTELWSLPGISAGDRALVELCCEGSDQVGVAYIIYSKTPSAANAQALAALKRELRADLALLGLSYRQREAMVQPARPRDQLLRLRRKA